MTQILQGEKSNPHYLTVWEHIELLRGVAFKCVGFFLVCVAIVHTYRNEVLTFILHPLGTEASALQFLSPLDPLYFILKIDFMGALLLSIPFIALQIWLFVSPGVLVRKSLVVFFFILALLLGLLGMGYAYYVVVPIILSFMQSLVIPGTEVALTAQGYLDFILTTSLLLFSIFQLPILLLATHSLGIVKRETLTQKRRVIYLVILIATAVITPTADVITLSLVAVPAILAFELGVLFIRVREKITSKTSKV